MGDDPLREWEPRTEAGRRLADHLNGIARTPYSGVSFPDIETDIRAIEAEAAALSTTPAPDLTVAHERVLALGCIRMHWGAARPCDEYDDGRDLCGPCTLRAALEGAPHDQ